MAVEEPPFRLELRAGAFEVRDYPALVVAETLAAGDQDEAAGRGFRVLAGYIFGGSTPRQTIAMTAPVSLVRAGDAWVVRFTMPRAWTLETLPRPNDPRVRLRALPPARLATLRFSGLAGEGDVAAKSAVLLADARARHLRPVGPVTLAQYDPPWTPWFMRRNEVMVAVER